MKHIFLDLEMNPVSRCYTNIKDVMKNEVIQIGAVLLDEDGTEIADYNTYVQPEYNNKIEQYYSKLTGIQTSMVKDAPVFKDAMVSFLT